MNIYAAEAAFKHLLRRAHVEFQLTHDGKGLFTVDLRTEEAAVALDDYLGSLGHDTTIKRELYVNRVI